MSVPSLTSSSFRFLPYIYICILISALKDLSGKPNAWPWPYPHTGCGTCSLRPRGAPHPVPPVAAAAQAALRWHLLGPVLCQTVPDCPCAAPHAVCVLLASVGAPARSALDGSPAAQRSKIQGRACPKLWHILGRVCRAWFPEEEQGPQSGTNQGPLTGVGEATGIPCLRVPKVTAVSHGIHTSVCAVSSRVLQRLCSAESVGFVDAGVPGRWLWCGSLPLVDGKAPRTLP